MASPEVSGGTTTQELFVDAWSVYRKMVDNDYLFHRGAYGTLRRILLQECQNPFTFLDVACGDAGMSVEALSGTAVSHYDGIDISEQALANSAGFLRRLACGHTLMTADFVEALPAWDKPVDVMWIGLSLHHLQSDGKLAVMREARRIIGGKGRFLIYEDASPDGEDRDGWMRRWDDQKPSWTAYSEPEWNYVTAHVHSSDFPETHSTWLALGRAAGFSDVQTRYVSPTNLFRLYDFRV
jgi:ubiquinone/menaquinone biosynthesis C-methylase UbiE